MSSQKLAMKVNSIRNHNIKVIMSFLYKKPYSCLELSKKIGISDVGVRKIIRELEELNFVKVSSEKSAVKTRGNQHIRYTANKEMGLFAFVDYTQRKERFYLLDFAGNILISEKFTTPEVYASIEEIEDLVKSFKKAIEDKGLSSKRILHLVVGLTGQMDETNRRLVFSKLFQNFMGERSEEIYTVFEKAFGCNVTIKNNVALMAMGEASEGEKKEYTMSVFVYAGFGISTTIMYNGEPRMASRGYAGEIGGNQMGFAQTLSKSCSLTSLVKICAEHLEERTFEGLIKAYKEKAEVKELVLNSAKSFARALSDYLVCLGADRVILSGEVLEFGQEYLKILEASITSTMYNTNFSIAKAVNPFVLGALKVAREQYTLQVIEERDSKAE